MRRRFLAFWVFISLSIFLAAPAIGQDYVLQLNSTINIPADCHTIYAGTTLVLERGTGMLECRADVNIWKDGDPTFFTSSDMSFSVPFMEPGEYVVYCGAPDVARAATTAACFTVLPQVVPALEEWGLIILTLLLLITSVLSLKYSSKTISSVR